jgi:pimeloyl-ACP methyl ester carboxylesterase
MADHRLEVAARGAQAVVGGRIRDRDAAEVGSRERLDALRDGRGVTVGWEVSPARRARRLGSAPGMELSYDDAGTGTPVVLLHGLTATRRYVVMGSKTLERGGHRVIAPDARGHGESPPGDRYDYPTLAADVLELLDRLEIEHAVFAGASMGAHTLTRLALEHPDRALGLVVVTPAFDPERPVGDLERWDALSRGLRTGGVEGFLAAYGRPPVPDA